MMTIPLRLDGYTDLPPGKIANIVTYLALDAPPNLSEASTGPGLALRRVTRPDLAWYRTLFRRVGENWLWWSRLLMADEAVNAMINRPTMEIFALEKSRDEIGIAELDRSKDREVEIKFFGVVPEAIGTGAARWMMQELLARALTPGIDRVWLHTCSFDHPAAIRFYRSFGFRPWKFAIEVGDDPRLTGLIPETAAPHVPLIRP